MRCSHLVALGCLLVALAAGAAQQPDPAPRYAIVRFVSLQCVKLAPIGLIEHNHPILLLRNLPLGRELQWRGHTRQGQTLALPLAAVIENQATLRLEEFEFLGRNQFIGEFTVQAAATASTRTVDFKELGHY
ncbi:MAG TPA: hypothetical protein PKD86_03375 [Gemmatales bacterium]|nr:hypothetical protein [Gemmatales bacterium]